MAIGALKWGLGREVPSIAVSAFGCRAILEMDGYLDIPTDRMDRQGSEAIFRRLADEFPRARMNEKVRDMVGTGELAPSCGVLRTLYQSDTLTVVANTNGSYGYLYIAAWTASE